MSAEGRAPDVEEAAAPTLTGCTAYRMLFGWPPNTVQPGDVVLVWGGSGGLGSLADPGLRRQRRRPRGRGRGQRREGQVCRSAWRGGLHQPQAVLALGRPRPAWDSPEWKAWFDSAKAFGKAIVGRARRTEEPAVVWSIPAQDTIPHMPNFVCNRAAA